MHLTPCRDHCHCSDIHALIHKCREVFPVCGRMKPFHEMHLYTKSLLVQCCETIRREVNTSAKTKHAVAKDSRKMSHIFHARLLWFGEFGIGPTAMREWSKPSCEASKAKPNP